MNLGDFLQALRKVAAESGDPIIFDDRSPGIEKYQAGLAPHIDGPIREAHVSGAFADIALRNSANNLPLAQFLATAANEANARLRAMIFWLRLEGRLPSPGALRISDLVRAIEAAAVARSSSVSTGRAFFPTEADLAILKALAERPTRSKAAALAVRGFGERSVKRRLRALELAGLVDRAEGPRSGWAITPSGRELVAPNAPAMRPLGRR